MKTVEYIIEVLICSGLFLVLYRWLLAGDNFFDGSVSRMVNFFSSQKSISVEETDEILRILNSGK